MLVSTHIKRAFISNMSLELCEKDEEMRKEVTRMATSMSYVKEMPEPSSCMFLNYFCSI